MLEYNECRSASASPFPISNNQTQSSLCPFCSDAPERSPQNDLCIAQFQYQAAKLGLLCAYWALFGQHVGQIESLQLRAQFPAQLRIGDAERDEVLQSFEYSRMYSYSLQITINSFHASTSSA